MLTYVALRGRDCASPRDFAPLSILALSPSLDLQQGVRARVAYIAIWGSGALGLRKSVRRRGVAILRHRRDRADRPAVAVAGPEGHGETAVVILMTAIMAASAALYVKDLQSMRAFYERCFAMSLQHSGERFCVLASSDWELSLVRIPDRLAAAVVIADPPLRRENTSIKLVFDVADLDQVLSLVVAAGGRTDPADGVWKFRGRLHRDCLDPEGNVLQLRQLAPT